MRSPMKPATGVWWRPAHGAEKVWVSLAFGWCMVLFAMMPLWHWKGGQNPSGIRHRVDPADFRARTQAFIQEHRVGTEAGIPVVEPPPGSDVYLLASMWRWTPVLRLKRDAEYVIHLSSVDVNHGFALFPLNINFQVVPGYDYGLRMTPREAGDLRIICNEFCGIGHHQMVGKIVVYEPDEAAAGNPADGAGDGPAVGDGAAPDGTRGGVASSVAGDGEVDR